MEIYNTYEDLRRKIYKLAVKGLSDMVLSYNQVNGEILKEVWNNGFDDEQYTSEEFEDYDNPDGCDFGSFVLCWHESKNNNDDCAKANFLYKKNVIDVQKLKDIINQAKILGKHYVKLDAYIDYDADDYIWSLEDKSYFYCDEVSKIWWDRKESKNLLI